MSTRTLLVLILALLGMMIYMEWQRDYATPPPAADNDRPAQTSDSGATPVPGDDLPAPAPGRSGEDLPDLPEHTAGASAETPEAPSTAEAEASRRDYITVVTDVLRVSIDPVGGTVTAVRLLDYPVSVDNPDQPYVLMERDEPALFIAQSGLLSSASPAPNHTSRFTAARREYQLGEGEETIEVPLTWSEGGVTVTKTFVFRRGDHLVDVRHSVDNASGSTWRGSRYMQVQRTRPTGTSGFALTDPARISYQGGAVYSPSEHFIKLKYDDFGEDPFSGTFPGGWAAMVQHYFLAAWIPPSDIPHTYSTRVLGSGAMPRYVVSAVSPQYDVAAGATHTFESGFYAGPKLQDRLDQIAPGLSLSVDYGIFTVLSKPLFWLLEKIHWVVGAWGWSIIILTLLIKLAFYRLTKAQFRSMAKLRKLQPRIQQLKERYGDDRQKFGQAMMDIYKKEKVNPLGGCLPILVQIPIFIALYWVLLESVELRQAGWLWVPDLSQPDPWFILPVINGVFMIITQRLMPTGGMDPTQAKIMQALPVVFAVLFAFFPAGLVLYWATNSGVSLLQQWWILRQMD